MERKNFKEYFGSIPIKYYPLIRRDVFSKMHISNQTYYNWINGKTIPKMRDYEALITIIENIVNL